MFFLYFTHSLSIFKFHINFIRSSQSNQVIKLQGFNCSLKGRNKHCYYRHIEDLHKGHKSSSNHYFFYQYYHYLNYLFIIPPTFQKKKKHA